MRADHEARPERMLARSGAGRPSSQRALTSAAVTILMLAAASSLASSATSDGVGGGLYVAPDDAFQIVLPPGWNQARESSSRSGALRFIYGSRSDIELVVSLGRRRSGLGEKSLLELVRADLAEQGGAASADVHELRIGAVTAVRVRRSTRRSEELHLIVPSGDAVFQFAYLTPTLAAFETQSKAIEAAVATVIPGREFDPSDAAARKQRYLSNAAALGARGDYASASALLDAAAQEFPGDADIARARSRLGARALVMPALALSNQVIEPGLDVAAMAAAPRSRASAPSADSRSARVSVAEPSAEKTSEAASTKQAAPVPPVRSAAQEKASVAAVPRSAQVPHAAVAPAPSSSSAAIEGVATQVRSPSATAPAPTPTASAPPGLASQPAEPAAAAKGHIEQPVPAARAVAAATAPASPAAAPILTLQVGAFSSQANAESMRARVAATIADAYVTEADVRGARVYRVRVGRFASLRAAREAESRLRAAGFDCMMLPLARAD
jgi:cell division protein FtsN